MIGRRITRGELNYPGIGSTEHGRPPEGYAVSTEQVYLGDGIAIYRRVARGLLTWQLQKGAGLRVRTDNPSVVTGARVVSGFGVGSFRINAPCEVVWVRQPVQGDHAQSAGFGYGTLPGHPERGEEAFEVEVDAEGRVFFRVTAFSKHSNWFYRAGGALAKRAQRLIASRYIESAHELAAGES